MAHPPPASAGSDLQDPLDQYIPGSAREQALLAYAKELEQRLIDLGYGLRWQSLLRTLTLWCCHSRLAPTDND